MERSPIAEVRRNHKQRENAVLRIATQHTLFCLQSSRHHASHEHVHRHLTSLLFFLLFVSGLWAAWQWWRPYELGNDTPWQVREVIVRRDHEYAWVEIDLTHRDEEFLHSPPLTRLVNAAQTTREPADARISTDRRSCQIRYWLEWSDLTEAWDLQTLHSKMLIKSAGPITLDSGQSRTFHQPHW